jgi:hypothetical protein
MNITSVISPTYAGFVYVRTDKGLLTFPRTNDGYLGALSCIAKELMK